MQEFQIYLSSTKRVLDYGEINVDLHLIIHTTRYVYWFLCFQDNTEFFHVFMYLGCRWGFLDVMARLPAPLPITLCLSNISTRDEVLSPWSVAWLNCWWLPRLWHLALEPPISSEGSWSGCPCAYPRFCNTNSGMSYMRIYENMIPQCLLVIDTFRCDHNLHLCTNHQVNLVCGWTGCTFHIPALHQLW